MSCGYMTKTESILTFIQISSFVVINRFCGNQDCAISAVDWTEPVLKPEYSFNVNIPSFTKCSISRSRPDTWSSPHYGHKAPLSGMVTTVPPGNPYIHPKAPVLSMK